MKASELINTLEDLIKECGDREITVLADGRVVGTTSVVYAASDGEDIIIETEY